MSEQTIRPYSMLIYGLQDEFIGVLKPASLESKGHITDPKMVLKNDGTQELEFSIPMYYTEPTTGSRIINPMWARTRDAELLANLRKIKVVFHPVENGEKEQVYEFVIVSKTDKHTNGTLECQIKCEGLAFRELGGTGYKLSLTQDDFLVEYNEWANRLNEPLERLNNTQKNYEEMAESLDSATNEIVLRTRNEESFKAYLNDINNKIIEKCVQNDLDMDNIYYLHIGEHNYPIDEGSYNKIINSAEPIRDFVSITGGPFNELSTQGFYGGYLRDQKDIEQAIKKYYDGFIYSNILNIQGTVLYYAAQDNDVQVLVEKYKTSLEEADKQLESVDLNSDYYKNLYTWVAGNANFYPINVLRTIAGGYISSFADDNDKKEKIKDALYLGVEEINEENQKKLTELLKSSTLTIEIVNSVKEIVERERQRTNEQNSYLDEIFNTSNAENASTLKGLKAICKYISYWQAYGSDSPDYSTDSEGNKYHSAIYYYNKQEALLKQKKQLDDDLIKGEIISNYNSYVSTAKEKLFNLQRLTVLTASGIFSLDEEGNIKKPIPENDYPEGSYGYFYNQKERYSKAIEEVQEEIEQKSKDEEPHMSLKYWCDKIFDSSTPWDAIIQMHWEDSKWLSNIVYEDEYISSWQESAGQLVASAKEAAVEKYRALECVDSNRYNITQELAKAFGVYCRYVYDYDEAYHIIGRHVIFYNNFFTDDSKFFDITYPYNADSIERTIESTDIITKMYVKDIEDATQVSGIISIADSSANKTGEDYILNFDYVHSIGSITDEQYEAVPIFEYNIHNQNASIKTLEESLIKLKTDLPHFQAEEQSSYEAMIYAQEQITEAQMGKAACLGNTNGIAYRGRFDTDTGLWQQGVYGESCTSSMALTNVSRNDPPLTESYGFRAKAPDEGIIADTISLFYSGYLNDEQNPQGHLIPKFPNGDTSRRANWTVVYDKTGMVLGVDLEPNIFYENGKVITNLHSINWSYQYKPALKYDLIIQSYSLEYAQQDKKNKDAHKQVETYKLGISTLEAQLKRKYQQKQNTLAEFQRLMGASIKEGNWQDDSYKDYGQKEEANFNWKSGLVWDVALEEENINYYKEGTPIRTFYYPIIPISNDLLKSLGNSSYTYFKNKLDTIFLCYKIKHKDDTEDEGVIYTVGPNSGFTYQFLKDDEGAVNLYAVVNDKDFITNYEEVKKSDSKIIMQECFFAQIKIDTISTDTGYDFKTTYDIYGQEQSLTILNSQDYTTVYPRVQFAMDNLKTTADKFFVTLQNNGTTMEQISLEMYKHFSLLNAEMRNKKDGSTLQEGWLISPKVNTIIAFCGENWSTFSLNIKYEISNASTSLYLDALEVMKTNTLPQISYKISAKRLPTKILRTLPEYLNCMFYINDDELFLDEVTGYISEVEMKLDEPWQDVITTKDYKTKFEDLFASIVAATEQMKSNGAAYDAAAAAFSVSGSGVLLNEATLMNSLHNVNLTQRYQDGKLTISDDGIIALSDAGAVAMSGGGIFCATEKDDMGRWTWNTGIVPEGINASMITAGHLDTNNISIYSGDNIALQMNANGLFAYKDYFDKDGNRQYYNETYVVHNDEGLFFHEPKEGSDKGVDRVEISWNGLIMRDNEGNNILYADDNGHLMLSNATIANATISNLKIAEIESLDKGVTFTPTKGTTFKYNKNTNQLTPNNLNFSVALAFVSFDPKDTLESDAFTIYRSFSDIGTEAKNWEGVEQLTSNYTAGHLTLTFNSDIMKDEQNVLHDVCYLRIVTRCLQNKNNKLYFDVKYLALTCLSDGVNGANAVRVEIISSVGDKIIENSNPEQLYTLTAYVYEGSENKSDNYTYQWYKYENNNATPTIIDGATQQNYNFTANDIKQAQTFEVEVNPKMS